MLEQDSVLFFDISKLDKEMFKIYRYQETKLSRKTYVQPMQYNIFISHIYKNCTIEKKVKIKTETIKIILTDHSIILLS